MDGINKFRRLALVGAEMIDSYRLIPRLIICGYAYMVWDCYKWFKNIPVTHLTTCIANNICSVTGIDGPSTQQSAVVAAIFGLIAPIFAFYANSSKKWDNSAHPSTQVAPVQNDNQPTK